MEYLRFGYRTRVSANYVSRDYKMTKLWGPRPCSKREDVMRNAITVSTYRIQSYLHWIGVKVVVALESNGCRLLTRGQLTMLISQLPRRKSAFSVACADPISSDNRPVLNSCNFKPDTIPLRLLNLLDILSAATYTAWLQ